MVSCAFFVGLLTLILPAHAKAALEGDQVHVSIGLIPENATVLGDDLGLGAPEAIVKLPQHCESAQCKRIGQFVQYTLVPAKKQRVALGLPSRKKFLSFLPIHSLSCG